MDELIEFLLELIIEGGIELLPNKNVPKWIRYPLAFIIVLFFLFIISFIILFGINILKESILFGMFLIIIGIFMLIGIIIKFIKIKKQINKNNGNKNLN